MGQKTHPIGLRLGIIKTWNSRWFASDRNFADLVHEDILIKKYIARRLDNAGIAKVSISRAPKKVTVDIHTSRPGIVIGRKGSEVDKLREELQMLTKKDIMLNIVEIRRPELDAKLVGDTIARQLEGRISFRRAMKKAMASTMKMGAVGVKLQVSGRLGGAEIARTEKYMQGRVPLHTLRADIDYALSTAHTTYGVIGVKVWICRGEVLDKAPFATNEEEKKEAIGSQQQQQPHQQHGGKRPGGGHGQGGGGGQDQHRRRPQHPQQQQRGAGGPGGASGGGDRSQQQRPRGRIRRDGPGGPGGGPNQPRGRRPEGPGRTDGGSTNTGSANTGGTNTGGSGTDGKKS